MVQVWHRIFRNASDKNLTIPSVTTSQKLLPSYGRIAPSKHGGTLIGLGTMTQLICQAKHRP